MTQPERTPVPLDVDKGCDACASVWIALQALLDGSATLLHYDGAVSEAAALDAIGTWWIAKAIARAGGHPGPMLEHVAVVCADNGIPIGVGRVPLHELLPPPQGKPS